MNSYNTLIPLLTLLSTTAGSALAQNFIQVAGTGIGTADSVLGGPGGPTSQSITINELTIPFSANELRQPSIPSYAQGQISLTAAAGIINGVISSSASSVSSAASSCSDGGCGNGHSSGTITSRITFRVEAPAVLYCQGVNSTQFVTRADSLEGGSASATADILLFGTGVGIQYYRQVSASGPEQGNGLVITAGGIARLSPGIDYRLDLSASAGGNASGSDALGAASASGSCAFWLAPDTCPTSSDPASIATCPTGAAPFSVSAAGTGPFNFQWEFFNNGSWTNLTNGLVPGVGNVAGATLSTLIITNSPVRTNLFRCVITNICGSTTSNFATLTVCPADFNCDGIVDFFDYLDFVDAFASNDPVADFNNDSILDFFDYLDFVDTFATGC